MSDRVIKSYKYLSVFTFLLIALGGSVRAMNAGLSCPDWPLCFGDIIPDYHPEVYFEFIHRVWAGLVGLVTLALAFLVIRNNKIKFSTRIVAGLSLVLLLCQVLMGGLTVLLQLHDNVVTAHLALGTSFFASQLWVYLSIRDDNKKREVAELPKWAVAFSGLAALVVYFQILLGGFVASRYAALVCIDFPTCNGELIPTLQGNVGLQVIHRLGAYLLTLILISFSSLLLLAFKNSYLRNKAWWILALIIMQVCLGISNVLLLTPPLITVLHLAVGTAILGLALSVFRRFTLGNPTVHQDVQI